MTKMSPTTWVSVVILVYLSINAECLHVQKCKSEENPISTITCSDPGKPYIHIWSTTVYGIFNRTDCRADPCCDVHELTEYEYCDMPMEEANEVDYNDLMDTCHNTTAPCNIVLPGSSLADCGGLNSDYHVIYYSCKATAGEIPVTTTPGPTTPPVTTKPSTSPGSSTTEGGGDDDDDDGGSGANIGAIIGGIFGVLFVICLVAGILFFLWRRKQEKENKNKMPQVHISTASNGQIHTSEIHENSPGTACPLPGADKPGSYAYNNMAYDTAKRDKDKDKDKDENENKSEGGAMNQPGLRMSIAEPPQVQKADEEDWPLEIVNLPRGSRFSLASSTFQTGAVGLDPGARLSLASQQTQSSMANMLRQPSSQSVNTQRSLIDLRTPVLQQKPLEQQPFGLSTESLGPRVCVSGDDESVSNVPGSRASVATSQPTTEHSRRGMPTVPSRKNKAKSASSQDLSKPGSGDNKEYEALAKDKGQPSHYAKLGNKGLSKSAGNLGPAPYDVPSSKPRPVSKSDALKRTSQHSKSLGSIPEEASALKRFDQKLNDSYENVDTSNNTKTSKPAPEASQTSIPVYEDVGGAEDNEIF